MIYEEIMIKSEIEKINKNFRRYVEEVFTSTFIKKMDRVFKKPLVVENFKQSSNIVALTSGKNIYINVKQFNSLPLNKAMMYVIHELFHVLQNVSQFPEVKTVNRILCKRTMENIPPNKINLFLTGKEQDIHSNYKDECLSYCSNFAFAWGLCPELKKIYFETLENSGIFNMSSKFWKERFSE